MLGDRGHAAKVARLAVALAVALDWPAHLQAQLHRAATLHDVGKRPLLPGCSSAAPRSPPPSGRTSASIRGSARRWPPSELAPQACGWIRHHHERWDGGGYPDCAPADAIPEGAQLLAISDAYDAMRERPATAPRYRGGGARGGRRAAAGSQFRPDAGVLLRRALAGSPGPEPAGRPTPSRARRRARPARPQQRREARVLLAARGATLEVRSHPGHRGVGVAPRELELDVAVEPHEALVARQLRPGRPEQAGEQALRGSGARSHPRFATAGRKSLPLPRARVRNPSARAANPP